LKRLKNQCRWLYRLFQIEKTGLIFQALPPVRVAALALASAATNCVGHRYRWVVGNLWAYYIDKGRYNILRTPFVNVEMSIRLSTKKESISLKSSPPLQGEI